MQKTVMKMLAKQMYTKNTKHNQTEVIVGISLDSPFKN